MSDFAPDASLLARCRGGDSAAWSLLVERYRKLVWSVIVKHRMRPEEAEDVFQHVFTTLISNIDAINDEHALASWIVTTTKRRCWRVTGQTRQAAERARSLDEDPEKKVDPADTRSNPGDTRALLEKQLVREGLERLGGKCKDLLEALFGAGGEPNYTLIAEKLGIRVGSIGPTRSRCLEKLSVILGRLGFGEDPPKEASDPANEDEE
ncbi:MAG: RNA polymerase sigma factor [Phycisphaerales bacterium]